MTTSREFLSTFASTELATTARVLAAFPGDRATFRPHDRSTDALGIAKTIVYGVRLITDVGLAPTPAPADFAAYQPTSLQEACADFAAASEEALAAIGRAGDADLARTLHVWGSTYTVGSFIHMLLCDQIHHRGQLSVYIRLVDGKVPAIYGPSADDDGSHA